MGPEKLWKFWDEKPIKNRWLHASILEDYLHEYPLCEKYIDVIYKNFEVFYNPSLTTFGSCNASQRRINIKPSSNIEIINSLTHEIFHLIYLIPGSTLANGHTNKDFENIIDKEVEKIYNENIELMFYIQKKFGIPEGLIYEYPNQLKLFR